VVIKKKYRVVIAGGGYAGLLAASRIAMSKADVDITLVDARPGFVQRIRLHEMLGGVEVKSFSYERTLSDYGIRFIHAAVQQIDPRRERVTARTPFGGMVTLGYDRLVIATGSRTPAPAPGVARHAIRLNDPDTIHRTHYVLQSLSGKSGRILIAGGGPTGIETAAELSARFPCLRVTLASRDPLRERYSPAAAEFLHRRLRQLNVNVMEGVSVSALDPDRAYFTGHCAAPMDLCVWAAGFDAGCLAREAGFGVDPDGRIAVHGTLQVPAHENIFAIGDAAAAHRGGQALRMGCATAMPMGAEAGKNVVRSLRGERLHRFVHRYSMRLLTLGKNCGLVQFTDDDDKPRDRILTGRKGRLLRDAICRMTYFVARNELRTGLRWYDLINPAESHPAPGLGSAVFQA
jgi:NADH dehydrogenase FAD-containing subunit